MNLEENRIQSMGEELVKLLEVKNAARERALADSRATIRNCQHSIRASHRGELETAQDLLHQAGDLVLRTRTYLIQAHPNIYWAGYVQDAQKEYAEANITYSVIAGQRLPDAAEL